MFYCMLYTSITSNKLLLKISTCHVLLLAENISNCGVWLMAKGKMLNGLTFWD